MYTAKHALLLKHKVPGARAFVFYMDIRAAGKGYEEFVHRVMEDGRVVYIRGRVSEVVRRGDALEVVGVDTLAGRPIRLRADLVVLAAALVPAEGAGVAALLRVPSDAHGFLREVHPKLRPVETVTAGVFLAGTAQAPRDIPDTVTQASAAASKGLELLSREVLQREPTVAVADPVGCVGCFECEAVCPYGAVERLELRNRDGAVDRAVAHVNHAVCEGCGLCTVACRGGNIDLIGCEGGQVFSLLVALGSRAAVGL